VHGGDDGHALAAREARDAADDVVGGGAVEAAGGLVQEEQRGAGEDLHADAHPPPLPAADAPARQARPCSVDRWGSRPGPPNCRAPIMYTLCIYKTTKI